MRRASRAPAVRSATAISSRLAGSSMVAGTRQASASAMRRMVPRSTLPERVFGRRGTTTACLKALTGPIRSRTRATTSATISSCERTTPAFSTRKRVRLAPLRSAPVPNRPLPTWRPEHLRCRARGRGRGSAAGTPALARTGASLGGRAPAGRGGTSASRFTPSFDPSDVCLRPETRASVVKRERADPRASATSSRAQAPRLCRGGAQ
jgi:hypothetical protein